MKKGEKELSFEENINKLEGLVKDLESGNVPLDDALDKFNEACILARCCDKKLKETRESVNKILNENGQLEDFKIEE